MDEHDPVDDGEFVFRRIHPRFIAFEPEPVVRLEAFRPSEADVTGLSVLRAGLAQPQDTFANRDPANVTGFCVARFSVRELGSLGLDVIPDPLSEGPRGHAAIPQLSWQAYQANKRQLKPILARLAELAAADIVYRASG